MRYRFNDYVLDIAQFALLHHGRQTDAQPQVLRLLAYLIENRDRVVTRDDLLDKLFGRRVVTDNALTVRIRDVRRAIGDTAKPPSMIQTVPGVGYRFVVRVEASSHLSMSDDRTPDSGINFGRGDDLPSDYPFLGSKPSIVVLPFEVIGESGCNDIIARGLVHDIITGIARTRAMLVIARGTAFQFPSGKYDVRVVGTKLGVRYVVQGAVQISGNKLRVSAGVASTETRAEIWSEHYDRTIDDVLTLQDEIAKMIVAALESEIQRVEIQLSILRPSSRLDAWSAYHRGLSHMYQFKTKDCDEAEKFFRRAIDIEPDVPRPYAGLSFVNYQRAYLNLEKERSHALRRSVEYAMHSVSIDPNDPMGHWALSRAQFLSGNIQAAKASIETATCLNPSYATAQYFLGWIAMQLGERELCLGRIDLARRLSPFDPLIYGMLGVSAMNLSLMGDHAEAIRRATKAQTHPGLHYQAQAMGVAIFALAGEWDTARKLLQQVKNVKPDYCLDDFFAVYAFQKQDDIQRISEALKLTEKGIASNCR